MICESEKREERKTVSCLSVRRGGIPRKQGLYLDKTHGEKEAGIRAERSLQVRIERIGYRVVGLLVRAEYLPYGVSGWTALAEVVAEDLSDGFRKKRQSRRLNRSI